MHIDDFVLALDLCKVTLTLAACAHQIEAHDHVEDLDGDGARWLVGWCLRQLSVSNFDTAIELGSEPGGQAVLDKFDQMW